MQFSNWMWQWRTNILVNDSFQDDFIFPKKKVIVSDYFGGKVIFSLNIFLNSDIFLLFCVFYLKSLHYFYSFLKQNSAQQFNKCY